jgi:hypothetical protein
MFKYSSQELVGYLKELYDKTGRTPGKRDLEKYSYDTYKKYFGSWNAALQKAGLPIKRHFYSDSEILGWIADFYYSNGRSPYVSEFVKKFGDTKLFRNRWKTWNNTLKTAGVPARTSYKALSDDEMIDKLVNVCEILGRAPKGHEFAKYGLPSVDTYKKRFNATITDLLKKYGYTCLYAFKKKHTEDSLISELKEVSVLLGHVPSVPEMEKLSKNTVYSSPAAYKSVFGSWNSALEKAGFKTHETQKGLSDKEILNIAKNIFKSYGDLSLRLLKERGITQSQIDMKLGGMFMLKKMLNIPAKDRRRYTKHDCINSLESAYKYFGHPPSINEYRNMHFKPSFKTVLKYFKTWNNALEEVKERL